MLNLFKRIIIGDALAIEAASFFEEREKDIAKSATLVVTPKK